MARIGGLYSMHSWFGINWNEVNIHFRKCMHLYGWELIGMEGCTVCIHGCNFCYRGVFNAINV